MVEHNEQDEQDEKARCTRWTDEQLLAFHMFEASQDTREHIDGHLTNCRQCYLNLRDIAKKLGIPETIFNGKTFFRCPIFSSQDVKDYLVGTLSDEKSDLLSSHLRYCPLCNRLEGLAKYHQYDSCDQWPDETIRRYCLGNLAKDCGHALSFHKSGCPACYLRWERIDEETATEQVQINERGARQYPGNACPQLNLKHFVMRLKGELNRAESEEMDWHLDECKDCKSLFEYGSRVMAHKIRPSLDDQKQFLRWIVDPNLTLLIDEVTERVQSVISEDISVIKVILDWVLNATIKQESNESIINLQIQSQ